jgi:predicted nucleotidyltransferase
MNFRIPQTAVEAYCRQWHITRMSLFGSALREDFRPDSDVDVMVEFSPEAKHSVFDLSAMRRELENLLGRKVDLVERRLVEESPNYTRRREILDSAEVIYGPGSGVPA